MREPHHHLKAQPRMPVNLFHDEPLPHAGAGTPAPEGEPGIERIHMQESNCWYDLLKQAMEADGENFDARICTLSEEGLRAEFDYWPNGQEFANDTKGAPFTAWGERWVYFPLVYRSEE